MDIKLIRAKRVLHVPQDPENPDHNLMRPVQSGLVALVPKGFQAPEDYYEDLGKVTVKEKPKK